MKRLWFGVGLLIFLLVVSICLGHILEDLTRPAEADLNRASVAALDGNWPLATALYQRAGNDWDSYRDLAAALARHDPIEEIDCAFAALPGYASNLDAASFCAACDQLSQMLHSLTQPHGPNWWNIL